MLPLNENVPLFHPYCNKVAVLLKLVPLTPVATHAGIVPLYEGLINGAVTVTATDDAGPFPTALTALT